MEPIVLSTNDYENIKNKCKRVGNGVDGSVYKIKRDSIYKFYHKEQNLITIPNAKKDDEGVIINDFKSLRPYSRVFNNENINYRDNEGIILTREEAIYKAIEKQVNVKNTSLPRKAIYVNNKIVGCEYKYYPYRLGIYACLCLPLKERLIICKRIIEKVKELVDNNIYPVTLAQRDEINLFKSDGSNVLIGLDLDPVIIDLDGISAMYSDSFSSKYYTRTISSLSVLILEILSRVNLANNIEDDEYIIEENINMMEEAGISSELSRKFFNDNGLNIDDIQLLIKRLEKRKK